MVRKILSFRALFKNASCMFCACFSIGAFLPHESTRGSVTSTHRAEEYHPNHNPPVPGLDSFLRRSNRANRAARLARRRPGQALVKHNARDAFAVVRRVTEGNLARLGAAVIEVSVVLPGEPHPALNLHRAVAHFAAGVARVAFG